MHVKIDVSMPKAFKQKCAHSLGKFIEAERIRECRNVPGGTPTLAMVAQKGHFRAETSGSTRAVRQLADVGGILRFSAVKNGIERQRARVCCRAVIVCGNERTRAGSFGFQRWRTVLSGKDRKWRAMSGIIRAFLCGSEWLLVSSAQPVVIKS